MIRALIVDDEAMARERIRMMLAPHADVETVGESRNGAEARVAILAARPDLMFLDIEMPELNGLSLLHGLEPHERPVVLFVTAYPSHALEAFDLAAADYLLKPFAQERFDRAVGRARRAILARRALRATERLAFKKTRGKAVFVRGSAIRRIVSEGNYARLHTDGRPLLVRETMQSLEARLDPATFVRVHRSVIVNVHFVTELHHHPDGTASLVLDGGEAVPIGPKFRARVERAMRG